MATGEVPIIKEYRLGRLESDMECIDTYPFNRPKQVACVLHLYPDKPGQELDQKEKSIFRGMVVPSLRHLGLVIGYGDMIHLSADAKLLIHKKEVARLHHRITAAVFYDIDRRLFGFLKLFQGRPLTLGGIARKMPALPDSPVQSSERVEKWCSILEQAGLIRGIDGKFNARKAALKRAAADAGVSPRARTTYLVYLTKCYRNLRTSPASVVNISDLRTAVALVMLEEEKVILVESAFDELLRCTPLATSKYIISLGQPMGGDEKLFHYEDSFYKTLSIRFNEDE